MSINSFVCFVRSLIYFTKGIKNVFRGRFCLCLMQVFVKTKKFILVVKLGTTTFTFLNCWNSNFSSRSSPWFSAFYLGLADLILPFSHVYTFEITKFPHFQSVLNNMGTEKPYPLSHFCHIYLIFCHFYNYKTLIKVILFTTSRVIEQTDLSSNGMGVQCWAFI